MKKKQVIVRVNGITYPVVATSWYDAVKAAQQHFKKVFPDLECDEIHIEVVSQ